MPTAKKSAVRSEQDNQPASLDTQAQSKPATTQKGKPIKTRLKTAPKTQDAKPKSTPKVNIPVEAPDTEATRPVPPKKRSIARDDGFEAMLNPFYYGKSLTDPIDTARVYQPPACYKKDLLITRRTNGISFRHFSRSKVLSNNT